MSAHILYISALLAGVLTGLLFFGGLWWTVKSAIVSDYVGLLFGGSFLLRTALTLAAFYLVGGRSWQRFLMCLVGFALGRLFVQRLSKIPLNGHRGLLSKEAQ